ncbi:HlyD family efflux transporter periplasmic adaptor subunit [Ruminococcus sp. MCC718]|uniref:HlyD family efflux transporter periplasmic adaptor subunit n=1 Tax=Ruminococcus sp. MCC718 TaxID=2592649 RepID=UPI001C02EA0F|nr:HlyD family efflux transporter periplasmic adaptor subunit [Ruminococcus sp. MCC718]MBT9652311.1 HlyD family efflux transporter periplasmic adaptor subunit [Ruminococcus sp. MCC718]
MKKYSKKKKWIAAGMSVVLVGGAAGGIYFNTHHRSFQAKAETASVQTATVERGDISTTVVGTGNLEGSSAQDVTMPAGVKVDKVLVESGDSVQKGDTLATVDADSVKQAMLDVQEEIDELDEEIEETKDDSTSSYVTAKVSGTVTKIYAKKGKDVSKYMARKGALMIIQMDDENKTEVAVTAAVGTVSKICVSEGDTVSAGDKLLYLADTGESSEYLKLVSGRKELAEYMQELSELSTTNKITADFDGTVQDVNVTASSTSGSSGSSSGNSSSGNSVSAVPTSASVSSATTSSKTVTSASAVSTAACKNSAKTSSGMARCTAAVKTSATATESSQGQTEKSKVETESDSEKESQNEIQKISVESIKDLVTLPVTGQTLQREIKETDHYTGTIVWESTDQTAAADTVYTAKVTLTAKSDSEKQYVFPEHVVISQSGAAISGVTNNGTELSFQLTFVKTAAADKKNDQNTADDSKNNTSGNDQNNSGDATNVGSGGDADASDNTQNSNGSTESGTQNNLPAGANGTQSNDANSTQNNNSSNGSTGGTQSASATSASTASSTQGSDSNISDVTAFTLSPDETMNLSISVDELDILSIAEGQSADITFDALENQTFTGTVTSISGTASVNGGVAKYTVEIEMEKDDNMRIGMNASATIKVEDAEDILLIPSAALQERGDSTFVYTGQSEDGTLTDEVEVETGLSDGSNVEITSGLSEGDTVYYTRTISDSQSGNMQGFGGFGDGQMPSKPSDMQGGPSGGGGQGGDPGRTHPNQ